MREGIDLGTGFCNYCKEHICYCKPRWRGRFDGSWKSNIFEDIIYFFIGLKNRNKNQYMEK